MAGYSGRSTVQKLGIKAGFRILVDGVPSAYAAIVGELPADVRIMKVAKPPLDMVHVFETETKGLAAKLRAYRKAIAADGMIWLSWPKKASGVVTDVTETVVRETALANGLVDVKVCAIDEIWSGLKLVIPVKDRAKAKT